MKRKIILSLFAFLISLSFSFEVEANKSLSYEAFIKTLSIKEQYELFKARKILKAKVEYTVSVTYPYATGTQRQAYIDLFLEIALQEYLQILAKEKGYKGLY